MTTEYNPFEALKNIPYMDDEFIREIAQIEWPDPPAVFRGLSKGKWPPVDVMETPTELIIIAAIPGLQQASDVRIELSGHLLKLEGEINLLPALSSMKVHQQEMRYGKFSRTVTLPVGVHAQNAKATYQRGILEVRLAKLRGNQVQLLTVDFFK